jgi:hypothetical protein
MLATGTEGPGFGGEKDGYLTVASSWKASISNGDDLIGMAMQSKMVNNWEQDLDSTQTFLWDGRQTRQFTRNLFDSFEITKATATRQYHLPEDKE